jgi:hypothetical protein
MPTPAMTHEERCGGEVRSWYPECPPEKLLGTLASAIALKIVNHSFSPKLHTFIESSEFGPEALSLTSPVGAPQWQN